jgi:hypothetical protein
MMGQIKGEKIQKKEEEYSNYNIFTFVKSFLAFF